MARFITKSIIPIFTTIYLTATIHTTQAAKQTRKDPIQGLESGKRVVDGGKESYSRFMTRMWDLDSNGTTTEQLVINIQGIADAKGNNDEAPEKLFSYVDENFLFSQPTVIAFMDLLDNYVPESGVSESYTEEENEEIQRFLDAVCNTQIMEETRKFLATKGKKFETMEDFKAYLEEIWFTLYPRSKSYDKPVDSSAFEHVFLGEVKKSRGKVSGLHNWIRAYLLERDDQLDYKGYVKNYLELQPGRIVMNAGLQMLGDNWKRPFSTSIAGSSLEFDLAAFTTCFALTPNKQCNFKVQGKTVKIQTMRFMSKNHISTAYPMT